jgi:hypothetical protein
LTFKIPEGGAQKNESLLPKIHHLQSGPSFRSQVTCSSNQSQVFSPKSVAQKNAYYCKNEEQSHAKKFTGILINSDFWFGFPN